MSKNIISLPILNYSLSDISSDIASVNINVYHNKANPNGSYFEDECFERSKESFKNKPLVAAITYDDDEVEDFEGHEDYEKPVGVIPETNNFKIVEIDGLDYANVDALIFKEYCNDAYELLKEGKKISMEIEVLDGFKGKDGFYHVKQFNLLGITILGDDYAPAMGEHSTITLYENINESFALKFSEILTKANDIYIQNKNKGGDKVKRDEIIAKFSALENVEEYKVIVENQQLTDEELEKQLFALSSNQQRQFLSEEISTQKYLAKSYWDNSTYERGKYYIEDIVSDDSKLVVYDCEDRKYYFLDYTFSGDKATIDYAKKKRCVIGDWREYSEGDKDINTILNYTDEVVENAKQEIENIKNSFDAKATEEYKTIETELETVKADFATLQTDKAELDSEVEELRQFKLEVEKSQKEEEVNTVLDKFSELKEVEGYSEIIEKKFDFTLGELETKLKVLAFDNGIVIGKKKNFTKQKENKILVNDNNSNVTSNGAWDIMDKYLKK